MWYFAHFGTHKETDQGDLNVYSNGSEVYILCFCVHSEPQYTVYTTSELDLRCPYSLTLATEWAQSLLASSCVTMATAGTVPLLLPPHSSRQERSRSVAPTNPPSLVSRLHSPATQCNKKLGSGVWERG